MPSAARAPTRGFQGRGDVERINFVSAAALTVGGNTSFSKEFRLGHGWWKMWLHFAVTVVIGTGTTPLADGLLRFVRKIFFKTDRGELVCNEPARAMFYIATYRMGAKPQITTLAASNGTYDFFIPILFADDDMVRPEDTILDTSRYQSLDLEIQTGSVADLYGTPGTATATAALDVDVERTYGMLPAAAKPHWFLSYDHRPPQDASVNPNVELEKSADLSYKRLYFWTGDTGTAGVPWSGNANDTYPQKTNIQDQERFIEKDRKHVVVQAQNKLDALLETQLAGIEVYDFVMDKSNTSALSSADKSALQLLLTQAGAAAGANITLTHEAIRLLKS
jgi:hypothetical protein